MTLDVDDYFGLLHKAPQGPFKQECAGMMKKEQNWVQQNELSTDLILELLHLTTESSINCDDFVQNLHIRNKQNDCQQKGKT